VKQVASKSKQRKNFNDIFSHLDTILAYDGWKDEQKDSWTYYNTLGLRGQLKNYEIKLETDHSPNP